MSDFDDAQMHYLHLLVDAGCKLRAKAEYFGKEYAWLTGPDGTWFLESLPAVNEDGELVG